MSVLEQQYDDFIAEFSKNLGKIDVSLALQTMYFQRKFTNLKPKLELRVCYRKGTDLEEKKQKINDYFACISTSYVRRQNGTPDCDTVLRVECLSDLDTIHKISKDPDIEVITGNASLGSY